MNDLLFYYLGDLTNVLDDLGAAVVNAIKEKIHDHLALIGYSQATQSAPPSVMITEIVSGPTILTNSNTNSRNVN